MKYSIKIRPDVGKNRSIMWKRKSSGLVDYIMTVSRWVLINNRIFILFLMYSFLNHREDIAETHIFYHLRTSNLGYKFILHSLSILSQLFNCSKIWMEVDSLSSIHSSVGRKSQWVITVVTKLEKNRFLYYMMKVLDYFTYFLCHMCILADHR